MTRIDAKVPADTTCGYVADANGIDSIDPSLQTWMTFEKLRAQATAGMKGKPSGSVALSRASATARPTARHDGRARTPDTSPAAPSSAFVGICSVIEFAAPGSNDTSSRRCSLSQECVQALGRIMVISCTPELTVASTVPPSAAVPRSNRNDGRAA